MLGQARPARLLGSRRRSIPTNMSKKHGAGVETTLALGDVHRCGVNVVRAVLGRRPRRCNDSIRLAKGPGSGTIYVKDRPHPMQDAHADHDSARNGRAMAAFWLADNIRSPRTREGGDLSTGGLRGGNRGGRAGINRRARLGTRQRRPELARLTKLPFIRRAPKNKFTVAGRRTTPLVQSPAHLPGTAGGGLALQIRQRTSGDVVRYGAPASPKLGKIHRGTRGAPGSSIRRGRVNNNPTRPRR